MKDVILKILERRIDSADVQGTLEGIAEEIVKVVETEISQRQRYASYCYSCALSGEHNVQSFKEFQQYCIEGKQCVNNPKLPN